MKKLLLILLSIIFVMPLTKTVAHEVTWWNLTVAHSKFVSQQGMFDFKKHVDSYMKYRREDVWKKYKDDEFEIDEKREETISMIKKELVDFDLNEPFHLAGTFRIGQYNFDTESFPVEDYQIEGGYQFLIFQNEEVDFNEDAPQLSNLRPYHRGVYVFINNHKEILGKGLAMPKIEAKKFVQSRKMSNGKVRRSLYGRIEVMITDGGGLRKVNYKEKAELIGRITKMTIYSDKEKKVVLAIFE